jgi:hypothetical protein
MPGNSLEFAPYRQAVSSELSRLGYQVVPGNTAAQVAEVRIDRVVGQPGRGRNPVSVGVGGSTGSYGSGLGLGVGFNLGGGRPAEQIDTELRESNVPAGGVDALWEGRARFTATANSDYASRQAAAAKLAGALFAGFPGRSGETIEVR